MPSSKWFAALALPLVVSFAPLPSQAAPKSDEIVLQCGPEGIELQKLVSLAQEVTGEPFLYEPKELADRTIHFDGALQLPRKRLLGFVERCLRDQGIVSLEQRNSGGVLHTLTVLSGQHRGGGALRTLARFVSLEELANLADRDFLVTTSYCTKNLPAREAVTMLQLYFSDNAVEVARNIEGTNSIVLTGFASSVAQGVSMLDQLDSEAALVPHPNELKLLIDRVTKLEAQVAALTPIVTSPPTKK